MSAKFVAVFALVAVIFVTDATTPKDDGITENGTNITESGANTCEVGTVEEAAKRQKVATDLFTALDSCLTSSRGDVSALHVFNVKPSAPLWERCTEAYVAISIILGTVERGNDLALKKNIRDAFQTYGNNHGICEDTLFDPLHMYIEEWNNIVKLQETGVQLEDAELEDTQSDPKKMRTH